jgi:ABC-2 type transport system permease protein
MQNTLAVAKREFASFMNSPIPYILVTIYILFTGYLFFMELFLNQQADMRPFFSQMPLFFCLFVSPLTMRLVAEERKEGTLELLLTMPLTDWQLLIGKFLAALGVMVVLLGLTVVIAVTVSFLGPLDKGATLAAYIGAILMAGAYVAIGIMASSFTRSQIVSLLLTLGIGLGLFMVGQVGPMLPAMLQPVAAGISISTHFQNIARGVIDTRDVLYYVSVMFVCLLVAQTTLESRRWR